MEENSSNNSLHEPTAEYGVVRKATTTVKTQRAAFRAEQLLSWEEVKTDMERRYPEILSNPVLYEEMKVRWEALNNPYPLTQEEINTRFEKLEAEIADGSICWRTNEEVFDDLERRHSWLCRQH